MSKMKWYSTFSKIRLITQITLKVLYLTYEYKVNLNIFEWRDLNVKNIKVKETLTILVVVDLLM